MYACMHDAEFMYSYFLYILYVWMISGWICKKDVLVYVYGGMAISLCMYVCMYVCMYLCIGNIRFLFLCRFLSEFDEVRTRILSVESLADKLTDACAVLEKKVRSADENMKSFMEKASELENKRNRLLYVCMYGIFACA